MPSKSTARLAQRVRNARFTGLIGQNGQTLMRIAMDLQDCGYQARVEVEDGGLRLPMQFFHEFVTDNGPAQDGPSIAFAPFPDSLVTGRHALYVRDASGDACADTWEEWREALGGYRRQMQPFKADYNRWVLSCPADDEVAVRRNLGCQLFGLIEQDFGLETAYELMGIMIDRYPIAELVAMLDDRRGLAARVQEIME